MMGSPFRPISGFHFGLTDLSLINDEKGFASSPFFSDFTSELNGQFFSEAISCPCPTFLPPIKALISLAYFSGPSVRC